MTRLIPAAIVVVSTSLLWGCAAQSKIEASPDKLSNIHSIAVVSTPEVKTLAVRRLAQGETFWLGSLIGGAVAEANDQARQDKLNNALRGQNLTVSANLANDLAAALSRNGFEARVEAANWQESGGLPKLAPENIRSDADGVLVVELGTVGFIAPGMVSNEYLPTITAKAELLGKDRSQVLYRGLYASGWQPASQWRHSPASATFNNFDSLLAHPSDAAASLRQAASAIASMIASDVKR